MHFLLACSVGQLNISTDKYTYEIAFCNELPGGCNGVEHASSCQQFNDDESKSRALGLFDQKELRYVLFLSASIRVGMTGVFLQVAK